MKEKLSWKRVKNLYLSGYYKPQGKYWKRQMHKRARKMEFPTNKKGIYNRIGLFWEWS